MHYICRKKDEDTKTVNMKENSGLQLSIIIPVYQVEKYVRPCLESVYNQGLDDEEFEVIIVNDGTKDRSMEVIQDIIAQHKNITVINQENQGLSMARNNGMAIARGEYILFVDSDDLLVKDSLRRLLGLTYDCHPDLITGDYFKLEDNAILEYQKTSNKNIVFNAITKKGKELFMEDLNPRVCYVCQALYRREFLQQNNISFIPNIFFEDTPYTHECYLKLDICVKTDLKFYIYRIGHDSITMGINRRKAMDYAMAIVKTKELEVMEGLNQKIKNRVNDNAFAAFSVLIYAIMREIKHFNEKLQILRDIHEMAPTLIFTNGLKQRWTTFMYIRMPKSFIFLKTLYQRLAYK